MKRVLVIRSGAVGDLILTLPVLSALKKRYSGLSIDMMGNAGRLALLQHSGYVDNVLSIDDRQYTPLFVKRGPTPAQPITHDLGSYDAIISYLPDSTGVFADNLRRIAAGPVLIGQAHPVQDAADHAGTGYSTQRTHMTHVLMEALAPLGTGPLAEAPALMRPVRGPAEAPALMRPVRGPAEAPALMRPVRGPAEAPALKSSVRARPAVASDPHAGNRLIAVHPGSGGREKCWPAERYAALIEALADKGLEPVVTFGPADEEIRSRVAPRIEGSGVRIVDDLNLASLSVLLARCAVLIGNDSGVTHLAAALGIPVVALFGPTDPAVWGPRGKQVRIMWGDETVEGDVGLLAWRKPFCPRRLADIDVNVVKKLVAG